MKPTTSCSSPEPLTGALRSGARGRRVQAFCAAKSWPWGNSLPPGLFVSQGLPAGSAGWDSAAAMKLTTSCSSPEPLTGYSSTESAEQRRASFQMPALLYALNSPVSREILLNMARMSSMEVAAFSAPARSSTTWPPVHHQDAVPILHRVAEVVGDHHGRQVLLPDHLVRQ